MPDEKYDDFGISDSPDEVTVIEPSIGQCLIQSATGEIDGKRKSTIRALGYLQLLCMVNDEDKQKQKEALAIIETAVFDIRRLYKNGNPTYRIGPSSDFG
jgi:hypothetical protein